jgi:16S rRNA processing protein RimM
MLETGANDVMVIKGDRERLIPFVLDDIVREVDLDRRSIIVDWPSDY